MTYLIVAFLSTLFLCLILIKLKGKRFLDVNEGVQKFHTWQTPRTGGLAIFISLWICYFAFLAGGKEFSDKFLLVIISSVPVFLGGFIEDITKQINAKARLACAFLSGVIAVFLLDANLTRIDIPYFDDLLQGVFIFSLVFTSFALAGVSNSINIIDGFNGLASGVCIMVFLSYAYVSFLVGDYFLVYLNLVMAASAVGFFLLNYPFGWIFLGDGGAYLLGYLAGLSGVLLVKTHPEVSAWFPLMLLMYPVWEAVFSIWRRKLAGKLTPFEPDSIHLHTLIYRRIIRPKFKKVKGRLRNSFTSPYLWFMQLLCTIPALIFWKNTIVLILSCILYAIFYVWIYFRIVRFNGQRILGGN